MQQVKAVFPYGSVHVEVVDGGLRASSGIAIAELGASQQQGLRHASEAVDMDSLLPADLGWQQCVYPALRVGNELRSRG